MRPAGEYVLRHSPDEVTEALNRVSDVLKSTNDEFVLAAARRILEHSEW